MSEPLLVTEDDLYALIGRQAVEIRLLRALLATTSGSQVLGSRVLGDGEENPREPRTENREPGA